MTDARELLRSAHAVLLDFDGPVTPLMPAPANLYAADMGRAALAAHGFDAGEIRSTSDHLAVIRWAGTYALEALADVEDACRLAELEAARTSTPTTGTHDLLATLGDSGVPVVIVTNNAAEAVQAYLDIWRLGQWVREVVGRPRLRPDLMKPNPHTIDTALRVTSVEPKDAVLIGDSVSDIEVARRTHIHSIGYAKTPQRGVELRNAGADAVTDSMSALATPRG